MNAITEFKGEYRWLSNFWPAQVTLDGWVYPSVEHAYQASKILDPKLRDAIRTCETPTEAKRLGRAVPLRTGWTGLRLTIMRDLVTQKFRNDRYLRLKLIETGDRPLVEGNTWGDIFWGVCNGVGENHLGRILMEVRALLASEESDQTEGFSWEGLGV